MIDNKKLARFFIVRHGDTINTERHIYCGRTDSPLTRHGIKEVKKLKNFFKDIHLDYIYVSPLTRCMMTALILRGKKNTPLEISSDIIEIDFGKWERLSIKEMHKRNPREFRKWLFDFSKFKMPGGESVKGMTERTKKFWRGAVKRHKRGNIVIVTHGGPGKIIIMEALGLPIKKFWKISIDTATVSVIESYRGNICVKGINVWGR